MSDLAHYRATRATADTPARRVLRFLLQPAALGLLLALLAASLLGNWFHRQAAASLVSEEQSRIAILEGSAFADFVAGTTRGRSGGHAGAAEAALELGGALAGRRLDPGRAPRRRAAARLHAPRRACRRAAASPDPRREVAVRPRAGTARRGRHQPGRGRVPQAADRREPGGHRAHPGHRALPRRRGDRGLRAARAAARGASPRRARRCPGRCWWCCRWRCCGSSRWRSTAPAGSRPVPRAGSCSSSRSGCSRRRGTSTRPAPWPGSRAWPSDGNASVAAAYIELRARVSGDAADARQRRDGAANPWDVDIFQRPRGLLARTAA